MVAEQEIPQAVVDVEPRAERLKRMLREAEQEQADTASQFSRVLDQDSRSPIALGVGDLWPAFSVTPMVAHMIARRELRAFSTPFVFGYRGPIVICATRGPFTPGCEHGAAVAVVNVTEEMPFNHDYLGHLGMSTYDPRLKRSRVIFFDSARAIVPFRVRGQPGVFRVIVPEPIPD